MSRRKCRRPGTLRPPAWHNPSSSQHGFVLVAVVMTIALFAGIAFLLNSQGSEQARVATGEIERDRARFVAEAGIRHARWRANQSNCSNYELPATPFGPDSYSASFTPSGGSPTSITVTATLAGGAAHELTRSDVVIVAPPVTETLQPDATDGKDTSLHGGGQGHKNYGTSTPVWVDNQVPHNSLFEFDLSSIPTGVTVFAAELEIYAKSIDVVTTAQVNVHRITRPWVEGSGGNSGLSPADGANFQSYDGTNSWTTPGGDFDPAAAATVTATSTAGQWYLWDVTGLVQSWVDETYANHGFMVRGDTGYLEKMNLASSDESDPTLHPKLTINYGCDCAIVGLPRASVLQPDATDGKDASIDASQPDRNFGAGITMSLDDVAESRILLEFDLSWIPPDATMTSAVLETYVQELATQGSGDIHRLTASWSEGSCLGEAGCSGGATWVDSDAAAPWATPGGDHVTSSAIAAPITSPYSWVSWDVAPLVAGWLDGSYPNHGMLLRPNGGVAASIASSDGTNASLAPRLTVTLTCPCGTNCAPPSGTGGGGTMLMVVGDPANLTPAHAARKALIEGWGHTVSLVAASETQSAFESAAAGVDVVYIPELGPTATSELDTKADLLATAVITEESGRTLKLGDDSPFPFVDTDSITIADNSHYITQALPLGSVRLSMQTQSMWVLKDTLAMDLQVLGELNGTEPGLAFVESGQRLNDGTPAAARRVKLPWGAYDFNINALTDDGLAVMKRAIEWGAGAGPPPPPPGYLDQFNARTCDPAVDYVASEGALDWSASSWTEINESDGSCTGLIQIAADPLVDNGPSYRLRVDAQGRHVKRSVDLSLFTAPQLSFDLRLEDYAINESLKILVSADGGSNFSEVGRFDGPLSHVEYQSVGYDLSPFVSSDAVIQFEFEGTSTTRKSYLDDVHIQEAGSTGCNGTFRDDFDQPAFSNDDGTLNWSGDWLEIGESDGPTLGDIVVINDQSNYQLRTRDNDNGGEGVEREADLSAATSATLTYLYRRMNLDNHNDYAIVEVSANGAAGPWTEVARHDGTGNDTSYQPASHDISAFVSANTRIRFTTSANMGQTDTVWFDDIQIECSH